MAVSQMLSAAILLGLEFHTLPTNVSIFPKMNKYFFCKEIKYVVYCFIFTLGVLRRSRQGSSSPGLKSKKIRQPGEVTDKTDKKTYKPPNRPSKP